MSRVHLWTMVEASPEEVWEVVANPRNLPRWNRHVRTVTGAPENGLARGSRYTTEIGAMGLRFHVDAEVVELDPPKYAQVRLHGPVDATVRTWVHRAGSRRARLEHEVEYRLKGGPLGEAIARVFKLLGGSQILRRGLRAQKQQVEEG
ncbi:MAG TPA: SRPBCC family protein [Actinomycetota bacterium]|nr:SRPBCC family protein [Actinomycetota bacterium]